MTAPQPSKPMPTMPDGKGLKRAEWEKGASYGWRFTTMNGQPIATPSFAAGFAWGRFWSDAKEAAVVRGEMVAGPMRDPTQGKSPVYPQ